MKSVLHVVLKRGLRTHPADGLRAPDVVEGSQARLVDHRLPPAFRARRRHRADGGREDDPPYGPRADAGLQHVDGSPRRRLEHMRPYVLLFKYTKEAH